MFGCSQHSQNVFLSTDNIGQKTSVKNNFSRELSIKDVKFDYDKKVFSDVKSSIIPATPLENKDDKPDYVQSRNVHFQIAYRNLKKSPASISVYNINEYKNAFKLKPDYVQNLAKSFSHLQNTIENSGKIKSFGLEELPFVPFIDAHQEFHAKAKSLKFQNGKGLLFLTQINQDVSIINNENLVYIFQGITDDKRYFIYAEFPVSAEGLPAGDADSFEDYQIPTDFYGDNLEANQKANKEYRNKIALKLENLKDEKFMPRLSKIESLLTSIKIR